MSRTVLIIGGYGVFGGRLAEALSQNLEYKVITAGRNLRKAEAFCQDKNCTPFELDKDDDDLEQKIASLSPDFIIDAAGPFQEYETSTHRLIEVAIQNGVHYLDLSDDAKFTSKIRTFDATAKASDVIVLSGASSVPALSSAAAASLSKDIVDIHSIESAILPGNQAPRGLSVIKAIISQVGNPLKIWRSGKYETVPGWSRIKKITIGRELPGKSLHRWSSLIGAPDLLLFPDYFNARNVSFRASLDLKFMHGGLWLLSWLVRSKLIKSLLPLAAFLKFIADRLEPFGSDIGAMIVNVSGITKDGRAMKAHWELVVKNGDGPNIPTIPAQILLEKISQGQISAGARPCLQEFSLDDAEEKLKSLSVQTSTKSETTPLIFQSVLGNEFQQLSSQHKDLHTVLEYRRWRGRASVVRGNNLFSKVVGWIAGFPNAVSDTSVEVLMRKTKTGETWERTFGNSQFRSHLSVENKRGHATLFERFGLMKFEIGLTLKNESLFFPVKSGKVLGLPLPRMILPLSNAKEYIDSNGRMCFHVEVNLPIIGHLATYSGWLESVE